jgi:lysozyme family protein
MAASNYAACLTKILRYEGGYVNDPHDPGGETNYGITVAVARANGYQGSMRSIPMDLVKSIYRKRYWDVVHGDSLPAGLDLCVFDYAVNSGPGRANPLLTQVNAVGGSTADRINRYCAARLAFLQRLATWSRYGKGWSSRVADVKATALKMAAAPLPDSAPAPKPASTASDVGKVAGGGAIVATGAAGVEMGWGATEWIIAALVLVALGAAAYFGWRWWKARQERAATIREAGLAAVAEELEDTGPAGIDLTADALAQEIANKAKGSLACQAAADEMTKPATRRKRTKRKATPAKRAKAKKRRAK